MLDLLYTLAASLFCAASFVALAICAVAPLFLDGPHKPR